MDLQKLLSDAGYSVRSYSGRGMYGNECLAVTSAEGVAEVALTAACELVATTEHEELDSEMEELRSAFRGVRQDSMGRDESIYYFPNISYEEDDNG